MMLVSQVIICDDFEHTIAQLESLKTNQRFIPIIKEDTFLVEDVKYVIEKASIASSNEVIIIIGAKKFSDIVQNKLLKILEEPPKNIIFIILANQKAMILDTIKSRLPMHVISNRNNTYELDLNVENMTLQNVYDFIKSNQRTSFTQMQQIVQEIVGRALKSNRYKFDYKALDLFSKSIKALNMGSNSQFILSTVLLKLLANKKQAK
ncbi:MAG: DNA polymerase III subunit delta' [Sulfurovaceae bacterium]|nr:DNA polymerase III subunit delta' [Sulfurovaceae bacterium]